MDEREEGGLPVEVVKVADAGRYSIVETHYQGETIKLLQPEGKALPSGQPRVAFNPSYTQVYADGWMVKEGDGA